MMWKSQLHAVTSETIAERWSVSVVWMRPVSFTTSSSHFTQSLRLDVLIQPSSSANTVSIMNTLVEPFIISLS